jgi:MFS family permease
LALIPPLVAPNLPVMCALMLLAGMPIAPAFAASYGLVGALTPPGTTTEAFAWLTTAIGIGLAGGSALAGALVDAGGPGAGFATAAAAGLIACAITSARRASLATPGTVPSVA